MATRQQQSNSLKSITAFLIKVSFFTVVVLSIHSCRGENKTDMQTKQSDEITNTPVESAKSEDKKVIMFYGNSLTAGYRLEEHESFPSRIEDKLDSLDMNYSVVNAGLSGDTSYDGLKRLDWVLNTKVDVFILELGANDMLRGLPLQNTRENLSQIIQKVKVKYPNATIGLCAMAGAPNMGRDYVIEFEKIYKDLSSEEKITLIPFFLEGVAGNPDLLLQDGKHPNAEGQKIVANNIWNTLSTML